MSHVSHERTQPRSWPKVLHPYQVWPRSGNIRTHESGNRLSRSKWFISSLSAHLMSHVSHERTRPRSWPKVRPYDRRRITAVGAVTGLCLQTDRRTDVQSNSSIPPFRTSFERGIKMAIISCRCRCTHTITYHHPAIYHPGCTGPLVTPTSAVASGSDGMIWECSVPCES